MLPLKNNLHKRVPGLAYRIVDGNGAGRVEWESESVEITADEALAPHPTSRGSSKVDDAVEWLKQRLATGCVESKQLEQEAEQAGHAKQTLWRARKKLGVRSTKNRSREGSWHVSLPDCPASRAG